MKALIVSVYRNAAYPDTTNCGVSAVYDEAYLVGDGVDGPWEVPDNVNEHDGKAVLRIHKTEYLGKTNVSAVPNGYKNVVGRLMFGGNFVYSSDSRFAKINDRAPVPVHDRDETVTPVKKPPFVKTVSHDGHEFKIRVHHNYSPGKAGVYVTVLDKDNKPITHPVPARLWREIASFIYCPPGGAD